MARLLITTVAMGICAAALSGCKKNKTTENAASAAQGVEVSDNAPDYQVYAPLPTAMTDVSLPMLVDMNGMVDIPCFQKKDGINTQTASMEIKANIEKEGHCLNKVMTRWFLEDLAPMGVSEDDLASWEFGVEYPVMLALDPLSLRFEKDQECIQETSGWLDDGMHVATVVVGARNFTVTSSTRLTSNQQDNIMEALKDRGFTMSGSGLDLYKPLYDSDGNPKQNARNEILYSGPGGIPIPENELPPEEERGVKDWRFSSDDPLFFAFKELPNDSWKRLRQKKECYVFVVWGDVKPRAPECEDFSAATFLAEKVDDQTVKVEIEVDSDSKTLEIPFETTHKVVMGDRVMLWINVKKEEEGATIRFNSLVIGELFTTR